MQQSDELLPRSGHDDAALLTGCAFIAAGGAFAAVAGNIVGSLVVPGHDFVADTISDLAAGRYEIIQDVALYGYSAALMALAIGAANLHCGTNRWSLGILSLAVLAGIVAVIGARNEYGDNDSDGVVIHSYLVYALGLFFTVAFFAMAEGLERAGAVFGRISRVCGWAWLLGAPVFFILPTEIDGLYERGLGLICIGWSVMVAYFLYGSARRAQA